MDFEFGMFETGRIMEDLLRVTSDPDRPDHSDDVTNIVNILVDAVDTPDSAPEDQPTNHPALNMTDILASTSSQLEGGQTTRDIKENILAGGNLHNTDVDNITDILLRSNAVDSSSDQSDSESDDSQDLQDLRAFIEGYRAAMSAMSQTGGSAVDTPDTPDVIRIMDRFPFVM